VSFAVCSFCDAPPRTTFGGPVAGRTTIDGWDAKVGSYITTSESRITATQFCITAIQVYITATQRRITASWMGITASRFCIAENEFPVTASWI